MMEKAGLPVYSRGSKVVTVKLAKLLVPVGIRKFGASLHLGKIDK
jgi:hypothetical protein